MNSEQFTYIDGALHVKAPAKINLSLLIAGKRDDGFHEIETIMSKIDFCDELIIEQGSGNGIELVCTGDHWAPDGEENLVWRAAEMMYARAGKIADIKLTLKKNIPAGTGLGSASSDAAATIMGVNKFAELNVSDEDCLEIASSIGSDVPFFLGGPLAICTGRGEKIEEIDKKFDFTSILVLSGVSVATAGVYGNYVHDDGVYQSLNEKINPLLGEKNIDLIAQICANMLEKSCFELNSRLAELKACIEGLGFARVCLSGSGSAMYCLMTGVDTDYLKLNQARLMEVVGCECVLVHNNRW